MTPEQPGYEERTASQPMTREQMHYPPPESHYGYGYGGPRWGPGNGPGYRWRSRNPIETKPFFLTSEFVLGVIAVIALLITAATNHTLGARFFWIWTSVILAAYMISRGIAKAGTRSRSYDPREDLSQMMRREEPSDSHAART